MPLSARFINGEEHDQEKWISLEKGSGCYLVVKRQSARFIGKTNIYFITKFGKTNYSNAHFKLGDTLIFGSEIDGLPKELLRKVNNKQKLFIPMNHKSRSLNLSNAVSICIYEAWKQNKFCN